jgi:large subunit ribosomal protein L31
MVMYNLRFSSCRKVPGTVPGGSRTCNLQTARGFPCPNKVSTPITAKSCSLTNPTRSCAPAKDKIKLDDGRELPLFKLETSSESHPFYTGTQKSVDSLGGRVEKFRTKFAQFRK